MEIKASGTGRMWNWNIYVSNPELFIQEEPSEVEQRRFFFVLCRTAKFSFFGLMHVGKDPQN